MNVKFVALSFFTIGAIISWVAHGWLLSNNNQLSALAIMGEPLKVETGRVTQLDKPNQTTPKLILDNRLLANPQLGKLIQIFKLDMSASEKNFLDLQLIQYAKSLLNKAIRSKTTESQLLTLSSIETIQEKVLPILILYYERSDKNKAAIDQLYKLRSLLTFDVDYNRVTQRIKELTKKNITYLMHTNQKDELVNFFQSMLIIEPDNYELQMRFAELEYGSQHYENALHLLSVLIYHPEFEQKALELVQRTQNQIDKVAFENIPVPIVKKGEQYIVSALINDLEPVKLLLDTGASLTILSPAIVNSLGIDEDIAQESMRFSTANGVVTAPIVTIDKITIQNYVVTDVQVGILDSFPIGPIDGLLGMNFLSHFSFFIDQVNLTLELTDIE